MYICLLRDNLNNLGISCGHFGGVLVYVKIWKSLNEKNTRSILLGNWSNEIFMAMILKL